MSEVFWKPNQIDAGIATVEAHLVVALDDRSAYYCPGFFATAPLDPKATGLNVINPDDLVWLDNLTHKLEFYDYQNGLRLPADLQGTEEGVEQLEYYQKLQRKTPSILQGRTTLYRYSTLWTDIIDSRNQYIFELTSRPELTLLEFAVETDSRREWISIRATHSQLFPRGLRDVDAAFRGSLDGARQRFFQQQQAAVADALKHSIVNSLAEQLSRKCAPSMPSNSADDRCQPTPD